VQRLNISISNPSPATSPLDELVDQENDVRIKRQWGFCYIMTKKSIKRESADVGLMFVAYNLRRFINIIGKNEFNEYLKGLIPIHFYIIYHYDLISLKIRHLKFDSDFYSVKYKSRLKRF
jgi:hypothetical protein